MFAKTRAENHNATRLLESSRLRARGATLATGHKAAGREDAAEAVNSNGTGTHF